MKNKYSKKAFTLMEILLVLAIIGVISALTLPSLFDNLSRNSRGLLVGKSIKAVEDACGALINTSYKNSETATGYLLSHFTWKTFKDDSEIVDGDTPIYEVPITAGMTEDFGDLIGGFVLATNPYNDVKDYSGSSNVEEHSANVTNANSVVYRVNRNFKKNGKDNSNVIDIIFNRIGDAFPVDLDESTELYNVYVDIDSAEQGDNRFGKDIFAFTLDNSGKMHPQGLSTYQDDCKKGNIVDGIACAARVVADGFKINY